MPKFHTAVCKYGISKLSPNADVWYYRGNYFYDAYNTMQQFDSEYSHGCYSMLPPAYTLPIQKLRKLEFKNYLKTLPPHTKKKADKNGFFMRLTKIYFKKVQVPIAFSTGVMFSFILLTSFYVFFLDSINSKPDIEQENIDSSFSLLDDLNNLKNLPVNNDSFPIQKVNIIDDEFISSLVVYSFSVFPNGNFKYKFKDLKGSFFDNNLLIKNGYKIKKGDRYHAIIKTEMGDDIIVYRN